MYEKALVFGVGAANGACGGVVVLVGSTTNTDGC